LGKLPAIWRKFSLGGLTIVICGTSCTGVVATIAVTARRTTDGGTSGTIAAAEVRVTNPRRSPIVEELAASGVSKIEG
jgi:hypothetical protein